MKQFIVPIRFYIFLRKHKDKCIHFIFLVIFLYALLIFDQHLEDQTGYIDTFTAKATRFILNMLPQPSFTVTGNLPDTVAKMIKEILAESPLITPEKLADSIEQKIKVKEIIVKRKLPNHFEITILFHKNYAIWQKNGKNYILNQEGKILKPYTNESYFFSWLLLGNHSQRSIKEITGLHSLLPENLQLKIVAAQKIRKGRWNLYTKDIVIKLPEHHIKESIATLDNLEKKFHILERHITILDLRYAGKIFVKIENPLINKKSEFITI